MRNRICGSFCLVFLLIASALTLNGCKGCTAQHDPTGDWKLFKQESSNANRVQPVLTDKGEMPPAFVAEDTTPKDPIDERYAALCSTCHGAEGGGDGVASAGLNPKARNFITWNDPKITDEYIAKVIREGGAAVGKSASMAAWGGVVTEEEIQGLVKKVRSFKK